MGKAVGALVELSHRPEVSERGGEVAMTNPFERLDNLRAEVKFGGLKGSHQVTTLGRWSWRP
jgi:hypothetical protein